MAAGWRATAARMQGVVIARGGGRERGRRARRRCEGGWRAVAGRAVARRDGHASLDHVDRLGWVTRWSSMRSVARGPRESGTCRRGPEPRRRTVGDTVRGERRRHLALDLALLLAARLHEHIANPTSLALSGVLGLRRKRSPNGTQIESRRCGPCLRPSGRRAVARAGRRPPVGGSTYFPSRKAVTLVLQAELRTRRNSEWNM